MDCFLCGSPNTRRTDYLRLNSKRFGRNIAYVLPAPVATALSKISGRFAHAYAPVAVNKKYFDRDAYYCVDCCTGWCYPLLSESELSEYYSQFYWDHRHEVDGEHMPNGDRPSDAQINVAKARTSWLALHMPPVESALDFGAGDCAGGYVLMQSGRALRVHVVDPSEQANALASKYGQTSSKNVASAPEVDLVYSAHAIEHVADLLDTMSTLTRKVRSGGFLFFETPNIASWPVFDGVVFTPHTYMLSLHSFERLAGKLGLRVVASDTSGPAFRQSHNIPTDAKTDLRVLLQRV